MSIANAFDDAVAAEAVRSMKPGGTDDERVVNLIAALPDGHPLKQEAFALLDAAAKDDSPLMRLAAAVTREGMGGRPVFANRELRSGAMVYDENAPF